MIVFIAPSSAFAEDVIVAMIRMLWIERRQLCKRLLNLLCQISEVEEVNLIGDKDFVKMFRMKDYSFAEKFSRVPYSC